ncbi:MAG: hypothetical protein AMXMBFR4_09250 [Candidatus Hydrogenedentota bacterium]
MTLALIGLSITLFAGFLLGLIRVVMGPTAMDSMMAAQLTSTVGAAFLVLLSAALGMPALVDVALVLVLLSAVAVMAFVRGQAKKAAESKE